MTTLFDYEIRLKIGWNYDVSEPDISTSFGKLVILPYDDLLADYSTSSIIISAIPSGSRTTKNNL